MDAFAGMLERGFGIALAHEWLWRIFLALCLLIAALWYLVVALRTVYGGSLVANVFSGTVLGVTYWMIVIGVTIAILLPIALLSGP